MVASVTESLKLSEDMLRLKDIFLAPSLQMISFTLTEKGYIIQDDTREFLPDYKHDARTVRKAASPSSAS